MARTKRKVKHRARTHQKHVKAARKASHPRRRQSPYHRQPLGRRSRRLARKQAR